MAHPKVQLSELREVLDTDLDGSQLQAFIDDAHLHVDGVLDGEGLSDDRLTMIEKYFAAGLVGLRDRRATEAGGAGTRVTYEDVDYFSTAFLLDTTGRLRESMESSAPLDWQVGTFPVD